MLQNSIEPSYLFNDFPIWLKIKTSKNCPFQIHKFQTKQIKYLNSNPNSANQQYVKTIIISPLFIKLQQQQIHMDIFQLVGDFLHLFAVLILLLKIMASKNVIGVSYKTQQLYLIVFMTRYSDMILENHWGSLYFNIMRIFFIFITAYTIRIIRFKRPFKLSYDHEADAFPHYWLYLLAIVLGFIMHSKFTLYGIFWAFSIWLQALAILPQLYMIAKNQDVENITAHYVLFLGFYRIFYLLHWIYNWQTLNYTSFIAGVAQTCFYADFIYYFMKSNQNQRIINLPI